MNASDIAAWWGAIIATCVILWEIYKHRSITTAQLRVESKANAFVDGASEQQKFIFVEVSNVGEKPTTIKNLCMSYVPNLAARVFPRRRPCLWISNPGIVHEIPYVLEPGKIWQARAFQGDRIDAMLSKGSLYVEVYHSWSARPARCKVRVLSRAA